MVKKARYRKYVVPLGKSKVTLYAGDRVGEAIELIKGMRLYDAVKILGLVAAAREQGRKEGAANAIDEARKSLGVIEAKIPHRNPGRPRKKK